MATTAASAAAATTAAATVATQSAAEPRELVVGVIFPAKKIGHLRDLLGRSALGVRFVLIDLAHVMAQPDPTAALLAYGHLDALLHKLAHDMVYARLGDDAAARRVAFMTTFTASHPTMAVIDPLDRVRVLTDRFEACQWLDTVAASSRRQGSDAVGAFHVPAYHVVDTSAAETFEALLRGVDNGQPSLPLIVKSIEACATDRSHMMSVVTQRADLQRLEYPAIYQEFINHSGRLFKGYVLGETISVAERRSLPNLAAHATHIAFNTQEKYPTETDFHGEQEHPTASTLSSAAQVDTRSQESIFASVRAIGERLRDELQLTLFGFDVIISDATHECFVVDVNYFPSYKELDDFDAILRRHIRQSCVAHQG